MFHTKNHSSSSSSVPPPSQFDDLLFIDDEDAGGACECGAADEGHRRSNNQRRLQQQQQQAAISNNSKLLSLSISTSSSSSCTSTSSPNRHCLIASSVTNTPQKIVGLGIPGGPVVSANSSSSSNNNRKLSPSKSEDHPQNSSMEKLAEEKDATKKDIKNGATGSGSGSFVRKLSLRRANSGPKPPSKQQQQQQQQADQQHHQNDSGVVVDDPSPGNYPVLSEDDVIILRKSFELVKADAVDIGALGIQHIFKKIPEAAERFCRNITPTPDGLHTNWELMENGFVFLSGIERCLLRLNRCESFENYVETLTAAHVGTYQIKADLMVKSLREFETVMLTFLQHITLSHDLDVVLNTWQKFFSLLCGMITAADASMRRNSMIGASSSKQQQQQQCQATSTASTCHELCPHYREHRRSSDYTATTTTTTTHANRSQHF